MRRFALALVAFLALVREGGAADRHIDPILGVNASACLDPGLPCQSLTYAMTQAADGDRILAVPGIYKKATGETFPIRFRRGVAVVGTGGASATTLLNDVPGAADSRTLILHFEGSPAIGPTGLEGFTVDGGGLPDNGFGIAVESIGLAPGVAEPPPYIRSCRIRGFADVGIQLITFGYARGEPTNTLHAVIERNEIRDCGIGIAVATRAQDGFTRSRDESELRNNAVLGCRDGIVISAEWDSVSVANPTGTGQLRTDLRHNTVLDSSSDAIRLVSDDALAGNGAVRVVVANNILARSGGNGLREEPGNLSARFREADASALAANAFHANRGGDYHDVDTATAYSGSGGLNSIPDLGAATFLNLDSDPLADSATGRLLDGSPCKDQASASFAVPDDIDGEARPAAGADIGADELSALIRRAVFTDLAPLTPARDLVLASLPDYLPLGGSPWLDPDAGVLTDAGRPLVVWQLPAALGRTLHAVKDPLAGSVQLHY